MGQNHCGLSDFYVFNFAAFTGKQKPQIYSIFHGNGSCAYRACAPAKPKGFSAKWKKQASQTNGYQLQYSTNSKFKGKDAKTVSIKKNRTTSKSVSKLKAKKKYYVRIRTYKTVKIKRKNVTLYSAWSKAKTVKTKK